LPHLFLQAPVRSAFRGLFNWMICPIGIPTGRLQIFDIRYSIFPMAHLFAARGNDEPHEARSSRGDLTYFAYLQSYITNRKSPDLYPAFHLLHHIHKSEKRVYYAITWSVKKLYRTFFC